MVILFTHIHIYDFVDLRHTNRFRFVHEDMLFPWPIEIPIYAESGSLSVKLSFLNTYNAQLVVFFVTQHLLFLVLNTTDGEEMMFCCVNLLLLLSKLPVVFDAVPE